MTTAIPLFDAPDLSTEDYVVLGLAACFIRDDDGVYEVEVVEPIPSAALEAIVKGIPTSYKLAIATTVGAILGSETPQLPAEFPENAQLCDDFAYRAIAAARTYKVRTVAQALIPPGTARSDFNHSVERKRVLNSVRIVRNEDNVKQHEYTHKVL
jgi:hypothetical protein